MRLRMGWAYGRIMPYATFGGAVGRFNTNSTIQSTWYFTRTNPVSGATEASYATGYTPTNPSIVGGSKKNTYSFGLSAGAGVDVEHVTVQRYEERFASFVPVVAHDAALGDARALAALNLCLRQRALLWRQRAGVYESIGRARIDVHGPQIEGHAVFDLRAQEGDARAVRGETQGPRARPGEFRRTVDALDRED